MSNTATACEVGHLYEVDPAALRIGANIRTDTHPDAKAVSYTHLTLPTSDLV